MQLQTKETSATVNTFVRKIAQLVNQYEAYSFYRLHIIFRFLVIIGVIGYPTWWIITKKKRKLIRMPITRMSNRIRTEAGISKLMQTQLGNHWQQRLDKIIGPEVLWNT